MRHGLASEILSTSVKADGQLNGEETVSILFISRATLLSWQQEQGCQTTAIATDWEP
jgi:hypothetical protein